MNKKDREELSRIKGQIQELVDELRNLGYAEQDKFDNLSENLQCSERAERYQEIADCIENVCSDIEGSLEELEDCEY